MNTRKHILNEMAIYSEDEVIGVKYVADISIRCLGQLKDVNFAKYVANTINTFILPP